MLLPHLATVLLRSESVSGRWRMEYRNGILIRVKRGTLIRVKRGTVIRVKRGALIRVP